MYSSVKVNGKKLYEYARKGETVERPIRKVNIDSIARTSELQFEDGNVILILRLSVVKVHIFAH